MPQFSEFPFSYLVHDIVMMGRSPHPRGPEDAILVEAAMERTEVTGLADREVTALSGGERSRVTLARVLAQDTPGLDKLLRCTFSKFLPRHSSSSPWGRPSVVALRGSSSAPGGTGRWESASSSLP